MLFVPALEAGAQRAAEIHCGNTKMGLYALALAGCKHTTPGTNTALYLLRLILGGRQLMPRR